MPGAEVLFSFVKQTINAFTLRGVVLQMQHAVRNSCCICSSLPLYPPRFTVGLTVW